MERVGDVIDHRFGPVRHVGDPHRRVVVKPMIVLDVDGVLYRWGHSARRVMQKKFGIDIPDDEWFGEHHVSPDQWAWMQSDEAAIDIFGNGEPFVGAAALAWDLRKKGWLRIITAVPKNARQARIDWLQKMNIEYDDIIFVEPTPDGKAHTSKSKILPHGDVYIDDNPNNCSELAQNTDALVILVDHSWNRDEPEFWLWPNIVRARTWGDVMRFTSGKLAQLREEEIKIDDIGPELEGRSERDETILEEAQRLVYGDRQDDYGHPRQNYEAIAKLFNGYLDGRGLLRSDMDGVDAAQLMVLMKIGRFATGSRKRDTLSDQAGYAGVTARIMGIDQ